MALLTTIGIAAVVAMEGSFLAPSGPAGAMAADAVSGVAVSAMAPGARDSQSRHVSLRDRALDAIKRHDFAEAEKLIREGRKTRSSNRKDQWKLIEARMELERDNYARAGLLAMQVVILRVHSDEHAAALYWAARAYEGLGRPHKAVELYTECRDDETAPESLVKVVSRRIVQLTQTDEPDKK